jgi:hypothetical protein
VVLGLTVTVRSEARALAAATDAVIARIVGWIGDARAGRTADMQLRPPRAAEG